MKWTLNKDKNILTLMRIKKFDYFTNDRKRNLPQYALAELTEYIVELNDKIKELKNR